MLTMEPKTFHDAIKPLVYLNCFAGIGALRQPNQSNTTYFFMKFYIITVNLSQWVTNYVTLNSIGQVVRYSENTPLMVRNMHITLVYMNSFITVVAPFIVWLRRKVLRDCLQQMPILDETFQTVLGVPNEYRKQFIHLICQGVIIILVMCSVSVYNTVLNVEIEVQMNIRSLFKFLNITRILYHPITVLLLLDVNFHTFLRYLGKKFRAINESLLAMAEKPSTLYTGERLFISSYKVGPIRPQNDKNHTNRETEYVISEKHHLLRQIRKAHLELCQLSRKINLIFGIQNLLSMATAFVLITGLLYTIYMTVSLENFTHRDLKATIPSAIWIVIYASKIWMVNHRCWSISSEAERTGEVIYAVLSAQVNNELHKEIQEFGLQILQNPVRFDACGFFTLDYTFVQGAIGSITTYLVILIQMSTSPDTPTSDSAVVTNIPKVAEN